MLRTTAGQLIVNEQLPEDLRDFNRVLDKKGLAELLAEVARRHPEQYRDVSHRLADVGRRASTQTGSNSFGLKHLSVSPAALAIRQKLTQQLAEIDKDPTLDDKQREERTIQAVGQMIERQPKEILQESLAENNPLAHQIVSGARGNASNLAGLRGSDLLYVGPSGETVPVPIMHSFSEGLTAPEYWAGSYGTRAAVIAEKMSTANAGFAAKKLGQAAHRLIVTAHDRETPHTELRGYPTTTSDPDNEGSLLASPYGGYKANTVLTPKILTDLKRKGIDRMLVRSPTVGGPADGGVFARDVGYREFGDLPTVGSAVGMTASQALSEPLLQAQVGARHSGGVAGAGKALSGFDRIAQMIDVPKTFKGGAAHAQKDGIVQFIGDSPTGGKHVRIDGEDHYVPQGLEVRVHPGDNVEAGDVLSEGLPNPAQIVEHKGIGEGRRYFTELFGEAFRAAGIKSHRRNVELVARGLIDHVRLNTEHGDWLPNDVVPYHTLEHDWEPREGTQELEPRQAVGKYLEKPVLHYSIGTKIRPSVVKQLGNFGVKKLSAHDEPPPFDPVMIRGMDTLQHDPDWMTKMYGFGLKKSLLHDVHRGGHSSELGTSFVPGLARGVDFGLQGKVKPPERPKAMALSNGADGS